MQGGLLPFRRWEWMWVEVKELEDIYNFGGCVKSGCCLLPPYHLKSPQQSVRWWWRRAEERSECLEQVVGVQSHVDLVIVRRWQWQSWQRQSAETDKYSSQHHLSYALFPISCPEAWRIFHCECMCVYRYAMQLYFVIYICVDIDIIIHCI